MTYDYSKLIGRIVEKYGTRSAFAARLGISNKSLSSKLCNRIGFKQSEIRHTSELLDISDDDIGKYFFCERSSKN